MPAIFLLWASAATPAFANESLPGNPYEGRRLAQDVCSACHIIDKAERGVSSAGAPAFQDVADDPAVTALSLRVFFRTPHRTMPNLILTEAETDNVIAYILGMK